MPLGYIVLTDYLSIWCMPQRINWEH